MNAATPRLASVPRTGLLVDALLIAGGAAFLALCAQISFQLPFTPVPITLQTFGVLLLGASYGLWRGGLTTLVHHVGDVVVGTAATLAGEGALGLTAAGLKPLVETLFAGWSAERGRVLAETLHDVVLGDRLDAIERLAAAAARPEVARARRLLGFSEQESMEEIIEGFMQDDLAATRAERGL